MAYVKMNLMIKVITGYFALLEKIQIILVLVICIDGFDRIDGADYRWVVFYDIPLKSSCIVSIVDTFFGV